MFKSIRNKTRRDLNRPTEDLLCQIACVRDERDDYEHQYLLSKLFQSEPASSRTIAVLHFIDGMTFEETAEMWANSRSSSLSSEYLTKS